MMLSRCDLWQLLSGNAHLWMDRGPCMEANIQLLARIPLRVARFASFSASPFSQDVFAISQKNMQCDCRLLVYVCLSRDLTSDGVVFRTMGLMPRRGNGFGLRKSKQGRIWQRVKKESNRRRLAAEDWAPTEYPLGKIWIKKLLVCANAIMQESSTSESLAANPFGKRTSSKRKAATADPVTLAPCSAPK
ncbi:hypothetical protein BKA81DRAFT_64988 [Phyllosticta paracitricarpa]